MSGSSVNRNCSTCSTCGATVAVPAAATAASTSAALVPVAAAVRGSDTGSNSASDGKGNENLGWLWEPSNVVPRTVPHQLVPATSTTVRTFHDHASPFVAFFLPTSLTKLRRVRRWHLQHSPRTRNGLELMSWLGSAWPVFGVACGVLAWLWLDLAWWLGGVAWLGSLWLGLAWLGLAWLGLAWLGLAWLGSCFVSFRFVSFRFVSFRFGLTRLGLWCVVVLGVAGGWFDRGWFVV